MHFRPSMFISCPDLVYIQRSFGLPVCALRIKRELWLVKKLPPMVSEMANVLYFGTAKKKYGCEEQLWVLIQGSLQQDFKVTLDTLNISDPGLF